MALPSIVTPEFTCVIPSTKQEITYRPFLIKEEKLLLLSQESGEIVEQTKTIAKILDACILTPDVDVTSLATFDLEYLFLKLRAKSVGEIVEFKLKHQDLDGPTGTLENTCTHESKVEFNIENVKIPEVVKDSKINITDDIGVQMRHPTFSDMLASGTVESDEDNAENTFKMINRCIEYVFDNENVYNDFTEQEMTDWIDTLKQDQFQKIMEFFDNMPKVSHELKWTCSECKKEETLLLEGLQSFF